jgi:hypothetical protein
MQLCDEELQKQVGGNQFIAECIPEAKLKSSMP